MKDLDHLILGALLHDIGKFWERANHPEITNTQQFCEQLRQQIPAIQSESLWLDLATGNNSTDQPALYQIIQMARKFARAQREESSDQRPIYLASLLAQIQLQSNPLPKDNYQHPLQELNLDQLYPSKDLKSEDLPMAYTQLAHRFQQALAHLPPTTEVTCLIYNLMTWFEKFLSNVPAEAENHDISLFDQLRVTAAIAEGLYRYHESQKDLNHANFADTETAKWLLVCGDFSGIQKFIYNLTQKGAAKGLRGRSLYIQLLCDGISQFLLQNLELSPTARIYSSGGKFYLLLAAGQESQLQRLVQRVNKWLLREFQGQVFLGIGIARVCGQDFEGGYLDHKWKEANENLQRGRLQRFRDIIEQDDRFFAPQPLFLKYSHCQACGRDDWKANIQVKSDDHVLCTQCAALEKLGQHLAKANYFLWVWGEKDCQAVEHLLNRSDYLFHYSFLKKGKGQVNLYLLEYPPSLVSERPLTNTLMESINHLDLPNNGQRQGFRYLGKWDLTKVDEVVDRETQELTTDWKFDNFASEARGVKRLGVLRMDVDNLGQIFVNGLSNRASLSRVATLSRQLNLFFSGHLNNLLKEFKRTQIIYAGGDDVFILGAWNELPDVAWCIRQKFGEYCADNLSFTLSGGMVMVGGTYPISIAAGEAGEAEHQAKHLKTKTTEKDAFCFLDTAIPWQMYESMKKVRNLITEIIDHSDGSRAIIDRLRIVVLSLQEFQRRWETLGKNLSEVRELAMYHKWRWQLVYNLTRMMNRYPKAKPLIEELQKILFENKIEGEKFDLMLLLPLWLPLPVRWAELLTRKSKDD